MVNKISKLFPYLSWLAIFAFTAFFVLLVLHSCHIISWSWWIVTLPL